ncbi:TetR/AcrR family transcriptional regulator [Salibacterium salarium]|uniref:TetR/AcrR family transcriptional regulator n=1 Tax=Salibacterium salarium TaxID=284579 RepID=A0A3R9PBI6_9BACI|nr:TetR/AcrR family transcriptional regulator [Salibacterium salarium]RSL34758.1 TetR/AcrR family transcriptional regulator [Salibacterium salarium]
MSSQRKIETVERKQQLTDVALSQFALNGYHKTAVSDVVKEAGVSQGTFYWYFRSKEESALYIIEEGKRELLKVLEQGYRNEEATVEEMLLETNRLFYDFFTFAEENRNLMILLLIKGVGADTPIHKAASETFTAIEKASQRNLERARELNLLPQNMDVSIQSTLITNMVIGTISSWLFGPNLDINYKPDVSAEKMATSAAMLGFYGITGY